MNDKKTDKDTLRTDAEAKIVREQIELVNPQPGEELLHKLLHELQVHQVQLNMQNDELRQAQMALEQSRDRYVDLYDFAPIGHLTLSREGMISELNLTAADMLGIVRKQLVSRRFAQFVAKEDRERWYEYFVNVLKYGQRQRCEISLLRGDGSSFIAQMDSVIYSELKNSSPPETKSERVSVVRIALSDISERIQSETTLHNARELNESIMDTVHEPLLVLDSALKVVSASLSFYEHFGVTPEDTLGRHISELGQHQWDIAELRNFQGTLKPHGRILDNFAVEHDFPNIGKRRILLNARNITGKSGVTQAILLAMNDVTAPK